MTILTVSKKPNIIKTLQIVTFSITRYIFQNELDFIKETKITKVNPYCLELCLFSPHFFQTATKQDKKSSRHNSTKMVMDGTTTISENMFCLFHSDSCWSLKSWLNQFPPHSSSIQNATTIRVNVFCASFESNLYFPIMTIKCPRIIAIKNIHRMRSCEDTRYQHLRQLYCFITKI